MNELAKFHEPDPEELERALYLRKQYTGFLMVGFTDEQALKLVVATIGTIQVQA